MSKQEDRDFCKIAIQAGGVSEEDAKRCLAYANKVEASGQPRPRVGSVFVKAKLLGQQDAQRIYAALRKRQGQVATAPRPNTRRTARGESRGAGARERRLPASSGKQRVSPNGMMLSVGSLVGLVIMVGIMVVLIIKSGAEPEPPKSVATDTSAAKEKAEKEAEAPEVAKMSVNPEVLQRLQNDLRQAVRDAQSLVRDDRYGMALNHLKTFDSRHDTYLSKDPYEELRRNLSQEIGKIEERIGEEFDATVAEAREHVENGEPDKGVHLLERLRDLVDDETASKLNEELEKLKSN